MKRILFIETNTTGTGLQAMKYAKKLGYEVHFWTSDLNQYRFMGEQHPSQLADQIETLDTFDAEFMHQKILNENLSFSGVLAFDDYHLMQCAYLAKKLSLPGQKLEALAKVRNKAKMREHLTEVGFSRIKQPKYQIVSETEPSHYNNIPFPCILKPVDDSGSNGVTICHTTEELQCALEIEKDRIVNERGYKLARQWLIEEKISGQEYSAELVYHHAKWKLISITRKETYGSHSVECGHVSGTFKIKKDIEQDLSELLMVFDLDYSAAHVEFFQSEDGLYLVEINPRLAGDCIPDLVEIATGVNMIQNIVKQSVGLEEDLIISNHQYAAIQFILPEHQGTYSAVSGVENLKNRMDIERVHIGPLPYTSHGIKSSYHRIGYVIAKATSAEDARQIAVEAVNQLEWSVR